MVRENVAIAIIIVVLFIVLFILGYVIYAVQHQIGFFAKGGREDSEDLER